MAEEKKEEQRSLSDELSAAYKERDEARDRVRELDTEARKVPGLQEELERAKADLADAVKHLRATGEESNERGTRLKELENEKLAFDEQEQRIAQLEKQLEDAKADNERGRAAAREKDGHIDALKRELKARGDHVVRLAKDSDDLAALRDILKG
jgi:chromosome segregation ATPase